jgi:hypothetical protein
MQTNKYSPYAGTLHLPFLLSILFVKKLTHTRHIYNEFGLASFHSSVVGGVEYCFRVCKLLPILSYFLTNRFAIRDHDTAVIVYTRDVSDATQPVNQVLTAPISRVGIFNTFLEHSMTVMQW